MIKAIRKTGNALAFYLILAGIVVGFGMMLTACVKIQPVVVNPIVEKAHPELMQSQKLPGQDKAEPDLLKRCIRNQARLRQSCTNNADRTKGLQDYTRKSQPNNSYKPQQQAATP